ncbi:DM13 domain-containing protein [Candidatus Uhrbacteria bacterium]|nr:DM13 domain-containing protein [Candidatus Uhrbacteria bacterium]
MKKYIITGVLAVIILPVAWYLISPVWNVQEVDEVFPAAPMSNESAEHEQAVQSISQPTVRAQGAFVTHAHEVQGTAKLIEQGDVRTLRFEDFETINGPDLHIYLATDISAKEHIDLGKIRGTKGNINYTLPASIDTKTYDTVLVWCVPFRVLFSAAELQ